MVHYDAFLSYSHSTGDRLATALERTLEELGKAWDERKILNVFRDVSKQGVAADLSADLLARLDASRYLVLLASPDAARSPWVEKEVQHWLATKGLETILLVLVKGDIIWNRGETRFDDVLTTALPRVLVDSYKVEPKWVDLRWTRDAEYLGIENYRFADCVADLSATILCRSKDDIFGIQLQEYKKGKARLIAEQANVLISYEVDIALLLAAAAVDLWDVPETRRSLVNVLEATADLGAVLGEGRGVQSIALDPAGERLLVGCRDGTIYSWSTIASGGKRAPFTATGSVTSLAFNEDGTAFVVGFEDGRILAATIEFRVLAEFKGSLAAELVAIDKMATHLAAARIDRDSITLDIWSVVDGVNTASIVIDNLVLHHLRFDGEQVQLFVAFSLLIFDARSGIEISRSQLPFLPRPGPMAYSADGRVGAQAQFDGGAVSLFGVDGKADEDSLPVLEGPAGIADCVALSGDHSAVALAGCGRLTVWSVATQNSMPQTCRGPREVSQLAIAPDATFVVAAGRNRCELRYPGRRSRLGFTLPVPAAGLPSAILSVGDVTFTPDSRLVAWITHPSGRDEPYAWPGETVAVWETSENRRVASIASDSAHQVAFADEGKLLLLDLERKISVWDAATGNRVSHESSAAAETDAELHLTRLWNAPKHGVLLLSASGSSVSIRQPLNNVTDILRIQSANEVIDLVANGNRFAFTDSQGGVQVGDVNQGVIFKQLSTEPYLSKIILSGDGRFLAIVSPDGDVSVFDVEAGERKIKLAIPPVSDAAVSGGGDTLFVLAPDGQLTAFDLSTGLISGSVQGTADTPWGRLVIAPDERFVAELIAGGGLTLWNFDPVSWRTLARAVAGRSLTGTERQRFGLAGPFKE